jgi:hypothetical protein
MNRPRDKVAQIGGSKVVRGIRLAAAFQICQRLLAQQCVPILRALVEPA